MKRLLDLTALLTILFWMTACGAGAAPSGMEAGRETEQTSAVSETEPLNESNAWDEILERNMETGNNGMGKFDWG